MEPSSRLVAEGRVSPAELRAALMAIGLFQRDAWCDRLLGLGEVPPDGASLPRGGVPYLPAPVDALLRMVDEAEVTAEDVFVDVGAGVGRAALLTQLLTGAEVVGVEIQPELARVAKEAAARLNRSRFTVLEGDAAELMDQLTWGTVFFFYCPFSGERLARVLSHLEGLARTRAIRVCCLDLPLPPVPWLVPASTVAGDLIVYRSLPPGP